MDKKQKLIIKIGIIILCLLIIAAVILFINRNNITRKQSFIKPDFETNSTEGFPEKIDSSLKYEEVKIDDNYIVYLCAMPKIDENILTLYFTSVESNKGLLKVRILDKDSNILGESGLINPNNYIKDITLNRTLDDNEQITVYVMNYEKDTYFSLGGIRLNLIIQKSK